MLLLPLKLVKYAIANFYMSFLNALTWESYNTVLFHKWYNNEFLRSALMYGAERREKTHVLALQSALCRLRRSGEMFVIDAFGLNLPIYRLVLHCWTFSAPP